MVTVSKVSPSVLGQGASKAVVLTGSGFSAGASVAVPGGGATVKRVVVVTGTQLKVKLVIGATATPGPRSIVVTNPDGGSVTCASCLTITPAPRITAVSPSAVSPGISTAITVTGTGFEPRVKVTAPKKVVLKATYVSSTQVDVIAMPKDDAPLGVRTLKVRNPDFGKSSCHNCLSVLPPVTVTSATPAWVSRWRDVDDAHRR